jgi:hypothetical protein
MNNPDSVKVDQQMEERSLFEVCLEKDLGPVDTVELHESLSRGDIDETSLVGQDNSADTLGVPKELIDIIVTDSLVVVLFSSQEFTVNDLVTLITQELVERLDDGSEVQSFGDSVDPVLTFGRSVVIVGTLEDEAQALGHESDLSSFTPTKEVKSHLSKSVILRHVVHGRPPSGGGRLERLLLSGSGLGLDILLSTPGNGSDSSETGVVGCTDGVVEIELSSKVPFSVVGVFTTNVVGVESEKSLIGRHSRCSRVELDHEEVVNVS